MMPTRSDVIRQRIDVDGRMQQDYVIDNQKTENRTRNAIDRAHVAARGHHPPIARLGPGVTPPPA